MQTQIPPAEDRWDCYLFRFHLILANKESRPPRRGSWRPWERRSGLFSGSALEAAAGHLQIWTSELPPGEAVSVFRKCKPRRGSSKVSAWLPCPHSSPHPFSWPIHAGHRDVTTCYYGDRNNSPLSRLLWHRMLFRFFTKSSICEQSFHCPVLVYGWGYRFGKESLHKWNE